jgi:hypothetical protein
VAGAKLERNVSPITCCCCLMLWPVPWKFLVYGSGDKQACEPKSFQSLPELRRTRIVHALEVSESSRARKLRDRKPSLFNAFEIFDHTPSAPSATCTKLVRAHQHAYIASRIVKKSSCPQPHARTSLQAQAIDKSRESQQNGTLRREYLDHLLFWTTSDLENKLLDFRTYFNNHRTHTSREGRTPDTPASRPIANLRSLDGSPIVDPYFRPQWVPHFSNIRAHCGIRSGAAKTWNEIMRCLRSWLQCVSRLRSFQCHQVRSKRERHLPFAARFAGNISPRSNSPDTSINDAAGLRPPRWRLFSRLVLAIW